MEAKDAAGRDSWQGGIPFALKRPLLRSCPETKSLTVRNLITPSRSTIQSSQRPKTSRQAHRKLGANAPGKPSQSPPASRNGHLSKLQRGDIFVDSEPPKTKAP